ncbi:EamA family transporter [Streptomyces sp. TS71-3]|uniref:EamA family transporter n=1 Tax=Streptomyces sp. TS71-3 TaxID=2733862 RepID=UPI001B212353|nr:EamA family transporter [Streptomyces sp. TS71-3]GHJ41610.1 multidrug transporter [Streptomyces sp. TS71-3]
MPADALALLSALCFGLAHFGNGLLARRAPGASVAFFGQLGGTALVLVLALFAAAPHPGDPASLGWGVLSGLGTGVGVAFLYRGLGHGRFSVVVPLSDVAAVALPVLVSVALLGDRPNAVAWIGIALSPFALWLVSRSRSADAGSSGVPAAERTASGAREGLIAGAGFALQFIALGRADPDAGMWPLVASRIASLIAILPMVSFRPGRLRLPGRLAWLSAGAGSLGTIAIVLYTLATREQLLSLAVVLTALYPAIPVLLGVTLLREHLTRAQLVGLLCAGGALALISLG